MKSKDEKGNGQGSELQHHNEDRAIIWFFVHLLDLHTGAIYQEEELEVGAGQWRWSNW